MYLVFNGEIKYILGSSTTKLGNMAYYFSEIENSICEHFIICSGSSSTHVKAIQQNVSKLVQQDINQKPWHVEYDNASEWILMDYSNIILHIFQEETRTFYNLEELWGDAKKVLHK